MATAGTPTPSGGSKSTPATSGFSCDLSFSSCLRVVGVDNWLNFNRLRSQNTRRTLKNDQRSKDNARISKGTNLGSPTQGMEGVPDCESPGRQRPDEGIRNPNQDPPGPTWRSSGKFSERRTVEELRSSFLF